MEVENDSMDANCLLGQTVCHRFKLQSILGEGSFATVFLAKDISNDSKVAVKCLYKTGLSPSQLKLQAEEVGILELVGPSRHIAGLIDVGDTDDHLFLVLEYAEIDLFDYILQKKVDELTALRLFEELVLAVALCHRKGVYHRDLKPENVLLTSISDPHVRLADFGLATTDKLSSEFGCGSVRYMAAELFGKGGAPYISAANDVWSLAIILINILTTKNPWNEPSADDRHFKTHLLKPQTKIDSFRSQFGFSSSFCTVLRSVFNLNPAERPTALEFLKMVKATPIFHSSSTMYPVPTTAKPTYASGLLSPSSLTGFALQVPVSIPTEKASKTKDKPKKKWLRESSFLIFDIEHLDLCE